MAPITMLRIIATGCALLVLPASVAAQFIAPSNSSILPQVPVLALSYKQTGMTTLYDMDPLTPRAGQVDQSTNILGTVRYTTATTVNSLNQGDFAYIECDQSAYNTSSLSSQDVMRIAANKIASMDPSKPMGAIILFSTENTACIFSTPADQQAQFPFSLIYTMTNSTASKTLLSSVKSETGQLPQSTIIINPAYANNATLNGGAFGSQPPTTAVAMIILYSITGIITLLFLVIIVTGAVRAHRHPERYGPRNLARPGQSRARGIARAMLESLPIVKFGEGEPAKPAETNTSRDIELGTTPAVAAATTAAADATIKTAHSSSSEESTKPSPTETTKDAITEPAEGIHPSTTTTHAGAAAAGTTTVPDAAENGLACSVCTDDFIKGQDTRVLPCNHKFHPECIDPWLLNVSGTCPLCRVDLRPPEPETTPEDETLNAAGRPVYTNDALHLYPRGRGNTTTTDQNGQRRPTNLANYISQTLNLRRMRDATPEQRVEALRGLRNFRRTNPAAAGSSGAAPVAELPFEESRALGSGNGSGNGSSSRRLSRFLPGRRNRSNEHVVAGSEEEAATAATVAEPEAEAPDAAAVAASAHVHG